MSSFRNAEWEDLKRDDVLAWLAWAYCSTSLEEIQKDTSKLERLNKYCDTIEVRSGMSFPPGNTPSIEISRVCVDPLAATARPLFLYLLTDSISFIIKRIILPLSGMHMFRQGITTYMLRLPPGWTPETGRRDPASMPILYLHGLGLGVI